MTTEEKLELIKNEIKKRTAVPAYKISLCPEKPAISESKVGGVVGYLPKGGKIPTDSDGNQLRLLAQINCRDVDLEEFPKEGILQFWIKNDDMYGCYFDNSVKDNFKVIYHEQIDESVNEEDILAQVIANENDEDEYCFPVRGECRLVFTKINDCMGYYDEHFRKIFEEICSDLGFDSAEIDIDDFGDENNDYGNHKIGGYPYFTQGDPRTDDNYDYLLFQLDTDDCSEDGDESPVEIMWGDCGVGNFFINKQKLIDKDFSDVLYNWDCG